MVTNKPTVALLAAVTIGGGSAAAAESTTSSPTLSPASSISSVEFLMISKDKLYPDLKIRPQELQLSATAATMTGTCKDTEDGMEVEKVTNSSTETRIVRCSEAVEVTPAVGDFNTRVQSQLNELGTIAAQAAKFNPPAVTQTIRASIANYEVDYVCPTVKTANDLGAIREIYVYNNKNDGVPYPIASSRTCPIPRKLTPTISVVKKSPNFAKRGRLAKFVVVVKGRNIDGLKVSVIFQSKLITLTRNGPRKWRLERGSKGRPEYRKPTFRLGSFNPNPESNKLERKKLVYTMRIAKGYSFGTRACTELSFRTYNKVLNLRNITYEGVCAKVVR